MKLGIIVHLMRPSGPAKIAIKEVNYLNDGYDYESTLIISKISSYHEYFYQDLLEKTPHSVVMPGGIIGKISALVSSPLLVLAPKVVGRESLPDPFSLFLTGVKTPKLDAALCHDPFGGLCGLISHKLRGTPYVCYIHELISYVVPMFRISILGDTVSNMMFKAVYYLEKSILKNAEHIIVQSQCGKNDFLAQHPYLKENVSILYPGCEPLSKPQFNKEKYAIAVSRWGLGRSEEDPQCRSASFILKIAKEVKELKFILAGSWEPPEDLYRFKKMLKSEGLEDRVELISGIPESEIRQLYANATVLLHWAVEHFGMCILEAMACGCPVITIKGAGGAEIIQHGVQGFIAERRDPEEYVEYINSLLGTNASKNMSLEAWKTANTYSWENHVKKLMEILNANL